MDSIKTFEGHPLEDSYAREELENKLDKPEESPEVGKVLKIKSVNEDGSFVCEWADAKNNNEWELISYKEITDIDSGFNSIIIDKFEDGSQLKLDNFDFLFVCDKLTDSTNGNVICTVEQGSIKHNTGFMNVSSSPNTMAKGENRFNEVFGERSKRLFCKHGSAAAYSNMNVLIPNPQGNITSPDSRLENNPITRIKLEPFLAGTNKFSHVNYYLWGVRSND